MENKRVRVLVHGRVQGVFFRDYTRREAQHLGLSGWVRNLATGSVEAEFEGGAEQLAAMLEWLSTGSPLSLVSRVEHREVAVESGEHGFAIRY